MEAPKGTTNYGFIFVITMLIANKAQEISENLFGLLFLRKLNQIMNKKIILSAAVFGLVAVILGAFGAHGLKDRISSDSLENWRTAVDYQFYHTFALLFLATFSRARNSLINLSYVCFTVGILLFCGSLYLLSTKDITGLQTRILGPITPIGGLFFIVGWFSLILATIRHK